MGFKIGLCGAPLSGKTTLGALLYAEFLKQGVEGAYLIDEYAKLHLSKGMKIDTFDKQFLVSRRQMLKELELEQSSMSPIICDSCVWLSKVYSEFSGYPSTPELTHHFDNLKNYKYDLTIFCPLSNVTGEASEYRIHDGGQAAKISYLIQKELEGLVVYSPIKFEAREAWVKGLVRNLINEGIS